jgi:hypothetical protein
LCHPSADHRRHGRQTAFAHRTASEFQNAGPALSRIPFQAHTHAKSQIDKPPSINPGKPTANPLATSWSSPEHELYAAATRRLQEEHVAFHRLFRSTMPEVASILVNKRSHITGCQNRIDPADYNCVGTVVYPAVDAAKQISLRTDQIRHFISAVLPCSKGKLVITFDKSAKSVGYFHMLVMQKVHAKWHTLLQNQMHACRAIDAHQQCRRLRRK